MYGKFFSFSFFKTVFVVERSKLIIKNDVIETKSATQIRSILRKKYMLYYYIYMWLGSLSSKFDNN